jgi:short subunit dehydrogenase-like uncharacterized protein
VTVRKIVKTGDVLVSTVGPFARYGKPALDAALAGKAHYLDSTGEPGFIRQVFEDYDARVKAAGKAFLPAFGYDYVPGNTVAAAALEKAGKKAVRVDVGYFVAGGAGFGMSQGTRASLLGAMLEPGLFYNDGARQPGLGGLHTRKFQLNGKSHQAISVPGSECVALPGSYPRLRDVNVYLGWFGALSPAMSGLSHAQSLLFRLPGYKRAMGWVADRVGSNGGGPDEQERAKKGSHIIAIACDADGNELATAELVGVNGYTYTANILAWGAEQALLGRIKASGASGPVAAFGLDALIAGNREAGLTLSVR